MIKNIRTSTAAGAARGKIEDGSVKGTEQQHANAAGDTFTDGQIQAAPGLYTEASGKKAEKADIERLQQQFETAAAQLRTLVFKLLNQQGRNVKSAQRADAVTAAEAQSLIAEDGAFGVEAVSDRLVSFAIAVSGDDPSELTELKAAIEEGFAEAERVFGGALPDICSKTYDRTMEKLDSWAAGNAGAEKTDAE